MDQRLISKYMMHFVVSINVVPFNVTFNYQSDLTFSTRLRVQLMNRHTLLKIKQKKQSKLWTNSYLRLMIWMIKISLGVRVLLSQASRDQLLCTELFSDLLSVLWQSWLSTWVENGHSGSPHVKSLFFQLVKRLLTIVNLYICICTSRASNAQSIVHKARLTKKWEMHSSLSGTTS